MTTSTKKRAKQVILLLSMLGLAVTALAGPQIGQPAPNFTAKDIFGRTVSLSDYKGKIVVLESYYNGCPFCENHYKGGAMQELQREMHTNGVVWLLINATQITPAKAKQDWLDKKMALTDWIVDTGDSDHMDQDGRDQPRCRRSTSIPVACSPINWQDQGQPSQGVCNKS